MAPRRGCAARMAWSRREVGGRDDSVSRASMESERYVCGLCVRIRGMRRDVNSGVGSKRRFNTCSIAASGNETRLEAGGRDISTVLFQGRRFGMKP